MSKNNGSLPHFLLFPDDANQWHLADGHGHLVYDGLNLSYETLLSLLDEAGASYKIIDPRQHIAQQKKGST